MDGLDVIDIPVKMIKGDLKMDLNGAQTLNPWIHDADGSHGGFWRNYLIVFGGGRQVDWLKSNISAVISMKYF